MMREGDASSIIARLGTLQGSRSNFDTLFDEVKKVVWPDGGDFLTSRRSPGEKTTRDIYEMTAALAVEKFAAAMESFLTSRTSRWHKLSASNDELNKIAEVKDFFEDATDALFKVRNSPGARFYGQMHEAYKSLGAYGNSCMFVDEVPSGGIRYKYTHIGQAWIEVNHMGVVDTVYYEYELSAKAAVQKWGDDAPPVARSTLDTDPFKKSKYIHCVRPNDDVDPERADAEGMAFESYHVGVADQVIIDEGGYEELPYIWSRYTLNPAEMYGRGPGMLVLPEIQTLQEMEKVFLRSGHKVADPPLLVANDGVIGRGSKRIRINPGGINMGGLDSQGRPMIAPLHTGARLDITGEMMDQKRMIIREAFLVNLFDLLERDRVQMTATEVLERAKEKGQLLTPVIGRQQSEFLGPMIQREIGIAQRQGMLPPLPDALLEAAGEYEIEYESGATRMQKSDEVSAVQRTIEVMTPFIMANPALLAVIKDEDTFRHVWDLLGAPSSLTNSEEEMVAIHKAQAQAAQAQQMREDIPAAAGVMKDVSAAQGQAA